MKINWENLKDTEKSWQLNDWKREQIINNCLQGQKAGGFSWRKFGIPLAYAGGVAAMLLAVLLVWPLLSRPDGGETVYLDGTAAPAPYVEKEQDDTVLPEQKPVNPPTEDEDEKVPADPKEEQEKPEESAKEEEGSLKEQTMVLGVEYNDSAKLERITQNDTYFDLFYHVYYYGIEKFYVEADGQKVELREAVKKDPDIINTLYEEWKQGYVDEYYDGGTECFYREDYTAFKLRGDRDRDLYYNDLIICAPKTTLSKAKELAVAWYTDPVVEKIEYVKQPGFELERLTKGELGEHFDYEIYYYGIENIYIKVDGKTLELREALKKDPGIISQFHTRWKEIDDGSYYLDGGSKEYRYQQYTAIKMHQMTTLVSRPITSPKELKFERGYQKDLIFCVPGATLNDVDDFIMIKSEMGGYGNEDRAFKATTSVESFPAFLVLKKNGRFEFGFSQVSGLYPQGVYTEEKDRLILQTTGEFDYKFVFKKEGEGYRFLAEESWKIPSYQYGENTAPICPLPGGTFFAPVD